MQLNVCLKLFWHVWKQACVIACRGVPEPNLKVMAGTGTAPELKTVLAGSNQLELEPKIKVVSF